MKTSVWLVQSCVFGVLIGLALRNNYVTHQNVELLEKAATNAQTRLFWIERTLRTQHAVNTNTAAAIRILYERK